MEETPENRLEFKSLMKSCFQKFRKSECGKDMDCDGPKVSLSDSNLVNHSATNILTQQKNTKSEQCDACIAESNQAPIQTDSDRKSNEQGDGPNTTLTGNDVTKSDVYRCLLIGLHCCGDLTPAMLKVYSEADFVRGLCCVSCCYHRMVSEGK